MCADDELRVLGLDIKRYLPLYLQSHSSVVLRFVEEVLKKCVFELNEMIHRFDGER